MSRDNDAQVGGFNSRYDRQVRFAPIGLEGQKRLSQGRVAVLGCGALGTVAAELLTRAGVGFLRLIDRDIVEWTNLQRQSLFIETDAQHARAKAEAAAEHLAQINSEIEIEPMVVDVTHENIGDCLNEVDLVIDAVDNFGLRFLLNDWSLATQAPWVHGGCVGATGQIRLFDGQGQPCFRCLVPEPPPASLVATCDTAGVLGGATHSIASLQVIEAMKWLSGNHSSVRKTVLSIDFWNNRIRDVAIDEAISSNCAACNGQLEFLSGDRGGPEDATIICGRDSVQIRVRNGNNDVDFARFATRWEGLGNVQMTRFFVRLVVDESQTITLFRDGRTLISGTNEISRARVLYDRYVGS